MYKWASSGMCMGQSGVWGKEEGGSGAAVLEVRALDKERARKVTPAELRSLCIDFQESIPPTSA